MLVKKKHAAPDGNIIRSSDVTLMERQRGTVVRLGPWRPLRFESASARKLTLDCHFISVSFTQWIAVKKKLTEEINCVYSLSFLVGRGN